MRNPTTIHVESSLGAVYIIIWTVFLLSLIFIALKNLNSEAEVLNSQHVLIKTISRTEIFLINDWLEENNIERGEEDSYRDIIREYPSKPWR